MKENSYLKIKNVDNILHFVLIIILFFSKFIVFLILFLFLDTVLPIPGQSQLEEEDSEKYSRPKTCVSSSKNSFTESNSSRQESRQSRQELSEKESASKNQSKRIRSQTSKLRTSEPNLLGQLNVDKKYLQNLLKCPG